MKYRIPVRIHKRTAKTKADISYNGVWGYPGAKLTPSDLTTRIVDVESDTHAGAYRELCEAVLPGDDRSIQGRKVVKYFAVAPVEGCELCGSTVDNTDDCVQCEMEDEYNGVAVSGSVADAT
jgi:hypothetical protein